MLMKLSPGLYLNNNNRFSDKVNFILYCVFLGAIKTFINHSSHIFIFSSYILTEGILKWQSFVQPSSKATTNSGFVTLALILSIIVQMTVDGVLIPRLVQGPNIYVFKVFASTLMFYVLLPSIAVVRNEEMRKQLKSVLKFCFSKPNQVSNLNNCF